MLTKAIVCLFLAAHTRSFAQTSPAPSASAPASTQPAPAAQDEVKKLREQLKTEKDARKKAEQKSEDLQQNLKDTAAESKAAVENAKKDAQNKIKEGLNQFKYINVSFGVLPNEDKDINNYSQISLNYSPVLQSSLTYYSRTTALLKKENTSTTDPATADTPEITLNTESEESSATKRTDFNIDLLRYAPGQFKFGKAKVLLSLAVGAIYSDSKTETNISQKNSHIDPATKRPKNIPVSGARTESAKSLLPQIVGEFKYQAPWALVRLSGGGIVLSRDKKEFKQTGAILFPSEAPDPKTNTPYKDSVYSEYEINSGNAFTASGYKLGAEVEYHSNQFGGFGLHFDYLEKFGDTKGFDPKVNMAKAMLELEVKDVYEERATMQLSVSHSMDYIGHLGVTPVLRFNSNTDRLIKTPKEGPRVDTKAKSYDFGVIFKY